MPMNCTFMRYRRWTPWAPPASMRLEELAFSFQSTKNSFDGNGSNFNDDALPQVSIWVGDEMRQNRQCIVVLPFLANDGSKSTNEGALVIKVARLQVCQWHLERHDCCQN